MLAVSYSHQSFEPIQSEIHSSNTKESKGKERKGEKRRRRNKNEKTERQIGTNDPKQNKETNYVNPLVIMARDPKYIMKKKKKRRKKKRKKRERRKEKESGPRTGSPYEEIESKRCEEIPRPGMTPMRHPSLIMQHLYNICDSFHYRIAPIQP